MASGWVKSLQCRSRAFEDVFNPTPKNLIPSSSCRKTAQSIKDVIDTTSAAAAAAAAANKKRKPTKPRPQHHHYNHRHHEHPQQEKRQSKPTSDCPKPVKPEPISSSAPARSRSSRTAESLLPALTELAEGHPSRNVVEIIFHTSWGDKPFAGRIEMIFKVQNGSRTVARFEEYREMVKTQAGFSGESTWEEKGRCVADGNEMMRFHCLGPTGRIYDTRSGAWAFPGGKGSAICTFSGSGRAHESAGGGRGRRAMLVCRVIAGRLSKQIEFESLLDARVGFDSVSGENGELLVFDPRAVLPCFLIIYKL